MVEVVKTKNLTKIYKTAAESLLILDNINFALNEGESAAITGESGSGKSTFLNMIGGLDASSGGQTFIDGVDITELDEYEMTVFRNLKIGFIFQAHYLLEEFNAVENAMIPFLMRNFNKKEARARALELLDYVGLSGRINHYPSQLSGGEKQRAAIARAFINNPKLILADEPTGNLDEKNSGKVLELLFNIAKEKKQSLVIVTHSKAIADLADYNYRLEFGALNRIR
ncbi:MAG TPA: ABC transporter ATP-binding protein [Spirochaetota bacterium]|jgi:lipoprotein-releasing system ATP-binding protein|nr:MAG: Lipoprotein-releasing system ATP-binding protein LolD [Spirochaetes bacterium ADurb.Bin133]HNZ27513.1 ABC transporter ATP-binding protein [Spirochaetota bacterium]HOF01559.1 ABC transporter ATP-binding protein [Spirochaetota bacterium]HOS34009.1 ABC transporter ATP-binding protein [Spirochaetota bacterium]HOS55571.1 ABC transporter ATP-binding protein [Spirochaetota bacterium]